MSKIIKFPTVQAEQVYSAGMQAVLDATEQVYRPEYLTALKAIDDLTDEETDDLFSYLWGMGYGEITAPTNS